MKTYRVTATDKTTILYEGLFPSFKDCLEAAIKQNTELNHADLSFKNLTNAEMDNACLPFANFTGANLTGANLSEAKLFAANFSYTSLFNTCFAYSDMQHCRFDFASFGATDFTQSDISYSYFAGQSCFYQDFMRVQAMEECVFGTHDGRVLKCAEPPLVVLGVMPKPMVFTGDKITYPRARNSIG